MAQSNTGGLSLRRHARSNAAADHDGAMTVARFGDAEWEAKEALRQRELEEARARAAQMEKTMRWWSDCTANWREKWSKVRNERNKARDEIKVLRTKLEQSVKDSNSFKREKVELEAQNDELKKEMEKIHMLLIKHAGQWDQKILKALEMGDGSDGDLQFPRLASENGSITNKVEDPFSFDTFKSVLDMDKGSTSTSSDHKQEQEDSLQGQFAVSRPGDLDFDSLSTKSADLRQRECQRLSPESSYDAVERKERRISNLKDELSPYDEEYLLQKLSMLQLRLEEATKTIQAERDEKSSLHRTIERLHVELQESRDKVDDLKQAKQETVRELLSLRDQHRDTIQQIQSDLQDETTSRESVDRRMADLRAEVGIISAELQSYIALERLQAENASEWGKRERLETEKLSLERDNKKLRSEVRDLQERLERRGTPQPTADAELRTLQQELSERTKELSDLKHSHGKLKKVLQDKLTELAHAVRRAEQYETEVKRLRSRVEELKRELAVAEDEVDSATNNIRKLQRSNDELQEQVENLQVQLEHLHTRLRNNSTSSLLVHRKQSPLLNEEVGLSDEDVHEY